MLVRFSVGNFCSYNEHQTISLISGNVKNHSERLYVTRDFKLLKFAAIFGANASGKSNIIKAVQFAGNILIYGANSPFADSNRYNYHRLNHSNKNKNSYFEFELLVDGEVYAYGFEICIFQKRIREEWLIKLDKSGNTSIFTRNTDTGDFYFNDQYLNSQNTNRMQIYLDDNKYVTDKLFLAEIVSINKSEIYKNESRLFLLKKIYGMISQINVSYPNTPVTGYESLSEDNFSELLNALRCFDTGISNIISKEISREQALDKLNSSQISYVDDAIEKLRILNSNGANRHNNTVRMNIDGRLILLSLIDSEPKFREIMFQHFNIPDAIFSLRDESDGTIRLLDLLSVIFANDSSIFIIDELDRSLHPQLTAHFIKTFMKIAERKNIQLIISTHESRLLNLKLLRQDEIYFVSRAESGSSVIIPFDTFKERFDKKIDVAYLDGRYGAVPMFNSIFPDLDDEDLQ